MKHSLSAYKILVVPAFSLLVLVLLIIIVFRVGISKIGGLRKMVNEARKNENILKQKEATLTSIGEDFPLQSSLAMFSLPNKNPSLLALSQIKNLALTEAVVLSNIRVKEEAAEKSTINNVNLGFDVEGEVASVLAFVNSIKKIAPILKIDKLKISVAGSNLTASLLLKSYWSYLPSKLSSIHEPILEMDQSERDIISRLEGLQAPSFSEIVPSKPNENPNPFGE